MKGLVAVGEGFKVQGAQTRSLPPDAAAKLDGHQQQQQQQQQINGGDDAGAKLRWRGSAPLEGKCASVTAMMMMMIMMMMSNVKRELLPVDRRAARKHSAA